MPLPPFRGATRIGAIATPAGALMGWLENADGDGAQQAQQIRLFTTAPDGVPLTEPRPLGGLVAYRDAGWSMVRIGDVIFVVFVQPEMGDRYGDHTRLIAQRVTLEGTAIGDPLELASGRFLRRVVARTDGIHLLVGYVENAGESTELSFVTLECQAP